MSHRRDGRDGELEAREVARHDDQVHLPVVLAIERALDVPSLGQDLKAEGRRSPERWHPLRERKRIVALADGQAPGAPAAWTS
jgi:hypothetical protein